MPVNGIKRFDLIDIILEVDDVVLAPVIREHERVGTDVTHIWSGNALNPSLGEPFESYIDREGVYLDQPVEAYFEKQETAGEEDKGLPVKPEENNLPPPNAENTTSSSKDGSESDRADKSLEARRDPIEEDIKEKPSQDVAAAQPLGENNFFWPESVRYSIHVNSFPEKELAQARIKELSQTEYECYMVYAHVPSMGNYYRIFVGKFDGFTSAQSFSQKLKGKKEFAKDVHVADRKWAFGG